MQKKLVIFFLIWFAGMFVVSWATSSDGKRITLEEFDFSTSDSDELYFHNVRSFFYTKEEHQKSGFTIYRLKKMMKDEVVLAVKPYIIHDWRSGQAFVRFDEQNDYQELETIYADSTATIYPQPLDNAKSLELAIHLYNGIEYDGEFVLHTSHKTDTIANNQSERNLLLTVIEDYFKLCGELR